MKNRMFVEELRSLVQLTQLYILQEYPQDKRIMTDQETFNYFKEQALAQKKQQKTEKQIPTQTVRESNLSRKEPSVKKEIVEIVPPTPPVDISIKKDSEQQKQHPIKESSLKESGPKDNEPQDRKETAKDAIKTLALEPVQTAVASDFSSIRLSIVKQFPHYPIVDSIPSDSEAKRLSMSWKQKKDEDPTVCIITQPLSVEEETLVARLCDAIDQRLAKAAVVSPAKIKDDAGWQQMLQQPGLKLLLISESTLKGISSLLHVYRQENDQHYLHQTKMLFIEEPTTYLREPQRKTALWHTLSALLAEKEKPYGSV